MEVAAGVEIKSPSIHIPKILSILLILSTTVSLSVEEALKAIPENVRERRQKCKEDPYLLGGICKAVVEAHCLLESRDNRICAAYEHANNHSARKEPPAQCMTECNFARQILNR